MKIFTSLTILGLLSLPCNAQQSDQERIFEDIDTLSVHIFVGLKIITSNPKNLPELTETKNSIDGVFQTSSLNKTSSGFSISEITQLAKATYHARALGKEEVAKGKDSNLKYISLLKQSLGAAYEGELSVEEDHAVTLAFMQLLKMQGVLPIPLTKKMKLYEVWMAGDAEFKLPLANLVLRAAQVVTFAQNDYCDFAQKNLVKMRSIKLDQVDIDEVMKTLEQLPGLLRVATHAPKALGYVLPVVLSPALITLAPSGLKIFAHTEAAGCYERKGQPEKVIQQYNFAVDEMLEMGIDDADAAFFRAYIAFKEHDYIQTKFHLQKAATSSLINQRTRTDLLTLADNLQAADNQLVEKYFSTANLSLTLGKIINQRLVDEGYYDNLTHITELKNMTKIYNKLMSVNTENAINFGKSLFNKLF
ncbi:MAG: hypothetical protein OFPII_30020 [Osedax symbiont Rs1]|nr:MAG: hypothetical protein OFPII_30020 [Osedax symbiont Rs1]